MPRRSALLSGVAGTEDGEVWAAGFHDQDSDERMRSVLHRSDDQWTPIRAPGLGWLQDVALDSAGVPWVVGYQMHDWRHVDPIMLRRTASVE